MTLISVIVKWILEEFKKENGIDLATVIKWLYKDLSDAAEKAKIELSGTAFYRNQSAIYHDEQ